MCIRPQTYESAEEAEILTWVFSDRRGDLHNTSFGILSSDGEQKLSRTGRSPSMVYDTVEAFEEALREIAGEEKTSRRKPIRGLPLLPDLRVALDVASADLRPLVILYSEKERELAQLRTRLEPLAWSESLIGRLRYVVLEGPTDLEGFEDMHLEPGITVVQAEPYGRGGELLAHAGSKATEAEFEKTLATGLGRFDAEDKSVRAHIRRGEREGIEWEPAIPMTDPGRRK